MHLGLHKKSDYVSFASQHSIPAGTVVSVGAWIQPADGNYAAYFVGNFETNDLRFNASHQVEFRCYSGSQSVTVTNPLAYKECTEIFVVGVRDGLNLYLYVNAELVASSAFSSNPTRSYRIFTIGQRGSDTGFYKGGIRGVSLWDKALSQAEITTLYNGGTFAALSAQANLVAAYNCTEGAGTAISDVSGNAKHGVIENPNSVYSHWFDFSRAVKKTFYVSQSGSSVNNGESFVNGWDIGYALSHPPEFLPGDEIIIEDGCLFQPILVGYNSYLSAPAGKENLVRCETANQYPPTVTFDSVNCTDFGTSTVLLSIKGSNTTYWDSEFTNSNPASRVSATTSSNPEDMAAITGLTVTGKNIKTVNFVAQNNTANGMTVFDNAGTNTIKNYVAYNNGWYSGDDYSGNGIYTHNSNSAVSVVMENYFSINPYRDAIQYFNSLSIPHYNFHINGMIAFRSKADGIVTGVSIKANSKHNFSIDRLYTFHTLLQLGNDAEFNNDISVTNSYLSAPSPVNIYRWNTINFQNNVLIGQEAASGATMGIRFPESTSDPNDPFPNNTFSNNNYYRQRTGISHFANVYDYLGANGAQKSFAEWQAWGLDLNSTFHSNANVNIPSAPAANDIKYLSDSETRRGWFAVYNYELLTDGAGDNYVMVDFSNFDLADGQACKVYHGENPKTVFQLVTYDALNPLVKVLMESVAVSQPTNAPASHNRTTTMPESAAFMVVPDSYDPFSVPGGAPNTPTNLVAANPTSNTALNLTWSNGGDAASDVILEYRHFASASWTEVQLAPATEAHEITGLTAPSGSKRYQFRVKLSNGSGDSDYTATIEKVLTQVFYTGDTRPTLGS